MKHFRYDPKTDTWTTVAPLSVPRDAVGICPLGDRLYAVGGYDGHTYLDTVESYDAQNNEWTEVTKNSKTYLNRKSENNYTAKWLCEKWYMSRWNNANKKVFNYSTSLPSIIRDAMPLSAMPSTGGTFNFSHLTTSMNWDHKKALKLSRFFCSYAVHSFG